MYLIRYPVSHFPQTAILTSAQHTLCFGAANKLPCFVRPKAVAKTCFTELCGLEDTHGTRFKRARTNAHSGSHFYCSKDMLRQMLIPAYSFRSHQYTYRISTNFEPKRNFQLEAGKKTFSTKKLLIRFRTRVEKLPPPKATGSRRILLVSGACRERVGPARAKSERRVCERVLAN